MKIFIDYALKIRRSLNKLSDYGYVKNIEIGEKIPKIVHQTYFTKELPELIKKNVDSLKANNPDWEFRLYNDEDILNFITTHFPNLLSTYNKINSKYGAARADFFRYLVIYKEGGVYLDIKSGANKPLTQLIHDSDQYILCHWSKSFDDGKWGMHASINNANGELQQWHVIAVKGHPLLKSVIENVCNNIKHYNPIFHDFGSWGVVNLTGPIAYTEAIYPLLKLYPHRIEFNHDELGLIYVAISSNDKLYGHHKVFNKTHYSKLEEPVVNQPLYMLLLFKLTKPVIKQLKIIKNS